MFDIGWSELLLIAVVTLIVVGPKELPGLLRMVGRYVGIVRRHASEFRAQFDDVIRETEIENLRDEMTELRDEVTATVDSVTGKLNDEVDDAKHAIDEAAKSKDTIQTPTARATPPPPATPEKTSSAKPATGGE